MTNCPETAGGNGADIRSALATPDGPISSIAEKVIRIIYVSVQTTMMSFKPPAYEFATEPLAP